jgi:beta-lactamase superfamily II metal-dependent hydrolase
MADFYEINFVPVHTSKSGDAIALRYEYRGQTYVHVVDGGFTSTAPDLGKVLVQYYGTKNIDNMVVTHPDKDHAEGLALILEKFDVQRLWMIRPWIYASQLMSIFSRYESVEALAKRLKDEYPYIAELERIANKKKVPISEPWQGQTIGAFRVLAPTQTRYVQLLKDSEKTPQVAADSMSIFEIAKKAVAPVIKFIKAGWGSEKFSSEDTSRENEMSVIQYAHLNNHRILLTGDAGRDGMTEAADYLQSLGVALPGIKKFQVPHHGGRRNLSTAILDRWVGPRLAAQLPEGSETFTAMISSAKEDEDHPRKAVVRALIHRGAFVATTENGGFRSSCNAPTRDGWNSLKPTAYPDEQEE